MGCGSSSLTSVTKVQAARAYAALAGLDPEGTATPESAAAAGPSYRLRTRHGAMVYTVSHGGGCCWIHAAAGQGEGMTRAGLEVIEEQAREAGCSRVGFQTLRRGLVRRSRPLGYRVTGHVGRGFILEKTIA